MEKSKLNAEELSAKFDKMGIRLGALLLGALENVVDGRTRLALRCTPTMTKDRADDPFPRVEFCDLELVELPARGIVADAADPDAAPSRAFDLTATEVSAVEKFRQSGSWPMAGDGYRLEVPESAREGLERLVAYIGAQEYGADVHFSETEDGAFATVSAWRRSASTKVEVDWPAPAGEDVNLAPDTSPAPPAGF